MIWSSCRTEPRRSPKDFGGTKIVWLNTGHYGANSGADAAAKLGRQFLRARFFGETAGFRRPDGLPARTIKLGLLLGGHEGVSPVVAAPLLNFDGPGRYTIDGQVTLHGLSLAASARIGLISSVGVEFPLLHGKRQAPPVRHVQHHALAPAVSRRRISRKACVPPTATTTAASA